MKASRFLFFACFFISFVSYEITASDGKHSEDEKKPSLWQTLKKKTKKKQKQPQNQAQEPQPRESPSSGGLKKLPTIEPARMSSLWRTGNQQTLLPTPRSGHPISITVDGDADEQAVKNNCDTLFIQPTPIKDFLKRFLSGFRPEERKEYEDLYNFDPTASVKEKKPSDYKVLCRGQTVLRRAVAAAYDLSNNQQEKHNREMKTHREELEKERATFEAYKKQEEQVLQQSKKRTQAMMLASAVSMGGIALAWASWLKNRSAQQAATA